MTKLLYEILIVEDNQFDFKFTKKLLMKKNNQLVIKGVTNISTACESIQNMHFDLIFLDLNLPDSNGLNSLSRLISITPDIPIIIITSHDDRKTAIEALNKGAQDYLIKGEISSTILDRSIRYAVERKKSADNLKKQNEFLYSILESLTYPFIVIDPTTRNVNIANSAARDLNLHLNRCFFNCKRNQTQHCKISECGCPVEKVKQTMKPVMLIHPYKTKENEDKIHEIHSFPIFNSSGELSQIILYFLDISEQEKTKLKYQMLSTVVQQSSDSILITNTSGDIEYINPAFQQVTGYSGSDILGKNKKMLKSDRIKESDYDTIYQNLKDGKSWQGSLVSRKKSGSLFEENVRVSPVKDDKNKIVNHVFVSRDITKEKRLESIAEAANLMTNIGYIFSGIRHEIGNPINSIKLALTVLNNNLKNYSREKIEEFTKRSLDEVLRVEYLLKALKNFSLFERPETQTLVLNKFIDQFVNLIQDDFKKKGIRVRAELPQEDISGITDPRALHQVLLNLFTNAADALEDTENPVITLQLHVAEGLIRLDVIDNGCGMDKEERSNLFKPFYTSKQQGTGLGLVIVKKMLARMQSTIKILSKKNTGTRIIIFIPEDTYVSNSKEKNTNH